MKKKIILICLLATWPFLFGNFLDQNAGRRLVSSYLSFSAAVSGLTGITCTALISSEKTITSDISVPSTMTLEPVGAGKLNVGTFNIVSSGTYQWTASGSGTNEYYLEASGGGDPSIGTRYVVYEDGTRILPSTPGTLTAGNWGIGNNDSLPGDTIYVRLSDDTDPDTKADGYLTTGYVVTIASPFFAPPKQVFSGNGTVVITGQIDRIFPEWWGAVYDDSNDDSYAFQQAFDTAEKVNGIVVAGAGIYNFEMPVIMKNYTTLQGVNSTKTIFYLSDGANCDILRTESYQHNLTNETDQVYIYDVYFNGNNENNTTGNCVAGQFNWSKFERCRFSNAYENGFLHSATTKSGDAITSSMPETNWTYCRFDNNLGHGLYSNSTAAQKGADCFVDKCIFWNNGQSGTSGSYNLYVGRAAGWHITNNQTYGGGAGELYIRAVSYTEIIGNHIDIRATQKGAGETGYGIYFDLSDWGANLTATGNIIRANEYEAGGSAYGVYFDLSSDADIHHGINFSNNTLYGDGESGSRAIAYDGDNTFIGNFDNNSFYDWGGNGNAIYPTGRIALVYNNAVQSIPNNTLTELTFNSEERDYGSWHSTVTNTGRLTVPENVNYVRIVAYVKFASNSTGNRALSIKKNGSGGYGLPGYHTIPAVSGTDTYLMVTTAKIPVIEGDYFTLSAYQDSGGALNADTACYFSIEAVD